MQKVRKEIGISAVDKDGSLQEIDESETKVSEGCARGILYSRSYENVVDGIEGDVWG